MEDFEILIQVSSTIRKRNATGGKSTRNLSGSNYQLKERKSVNKKQNLLYLHLYQQRENGKNINIKYAFLQGEHCKTSKQGLFSFTSITFYQLRFFFLFFSKKKLGEDKNFAPSN